MEFQGSVIKPLEQEAGKFRMFLEAEKFAEELCQFHKSLGASDDLAKWLADGWLSSFHGMYERRPRLRGRDRAYRPREGNSATGHSDQGQAGQASDGQSDSKDSPK